MVIKFFLVWRDNCPIIISVTAIVITIFLSEINKTHRVEIAQKKQTKKMKTILIKLFVGQGFGQSPSFCLWSDFRA